MGLRFQNERELRKSLGAILDLVQDLPRRRARAIHGIVQRGILRNYETLRKGGHVSTSEGGLAVSWLQVRSPITAAIRNRRGLGSVFPMLTLTGRLRGGLMTSGRVSARKGYFAWQPATTYLDLIRLHHLGGEPFPRTLKGAKNPFFGHGQVPARPMIFWSEQMTDEVLMLALEAPLR